MKLGAPADQRCLQTARRPQAGGAHAQAFRAGTRVTPREQQGAAAGRQLRRLGPQADASAGCSRRVGCRQCIGRQHGGQRKRLQVEGRQAMSTRANRRRRRRRSSLARQSCGLPLLWHAPPAVLHPPLCTCGGGLPASPRGCSRCRSTCRDDWGTRMCICDGGGRAGGRAVLGSRPLRLT